MDIYITDLPVFIYSIYIGLLFILMILLTFSCSLLITELNRNEWLNRRFGASSQIYFIYSFPVKLDWSFAFKYARLDKAELIKLSNMISIPLDKLNFIRRTIRLFLFLYSIIPVSILIFCICNIVKICLANK